MKKKKKTGINEFKSINTLTLNKYCIVKRYKNKIYNKKKEINILLHVLFVCWFFVFFTKWNTAENMLSFMPTRAQFSFIYEMAAHYF